MAGLFNVGAPIRSNVSVTQVVGLVSTGLVRSAVEIAAVDGVAIAPLGGSFESLWPLRAFESGQDSFEHSGRPVGTENGQSVSRGGSGFATSCVTTRRLAGNSKVLAFSNVVVADRSFDKPSNT